MERRSNLFSSPKTPVKRVVKESFWSKLSSRLTPKKKFIAGSSSSKSTYYKPSSIRRKSSFDSQTKDNFKVFKPATDTLIKEKVKNTINVNPGVIKKFAFGYKNLDFIQRNTSILNFGNFWKNINFYIVKWRIIEKFNRFLAIILASSAIICLIYISFFDRFFLVKTYSVSFSDNSFLDNDEVNQITTQFSQQKILGVLPNNQYWFLSDYNLTQIAKKTIPEVQSVQITDRVWPNKVDLKITTDPVLVTLGVMENNQKKYWRISQTGKVIDEDTLNLRQNVVEVDKIISFDKPGSSLKDYPLQDNQDQLNRYWFVLWLWSAMSSLNINVAKTVFPTLLDTDVEIITDQGTKLLFDTDAMSKDNQFQRIKATLNTTINNNLVRTMLDSGKLNYIDFRIPKKVFVCDTGKSCNSTE
jgi:hypothetical protein